MNASNLLNAHLETCFCLRDACLLVVVVAAASSSSTACIGTVFVYAKFDTRSVVKSKNTALSMILNDV